MKLKTKVQNILLIALLILVVMASGITSETPIDAIFVLLIAIGSLFGILIRFGSYGHE